MIRVTTKGTGKSLSIFNYATAKSLNILNLAAAKLVERRVGSALRASYSHAVGEVSRALTSSMPSSIDVTGVKRIPYTRLDGGSGRLSTVPWKKLSNKYTDPEEPPTWWSKKTPGTPFWYNTGALASAAIRMSSRPPTFRGLFAQVLGLTSSFGGKADGNVTKVSGGKPTRTHHKDRFRVESVWKFEPLLDKYMDELIRGPFVTGDSNAVDKGMSFNTRGPATWKLWINEMGREGKNKSSYYTGRPWVADLSARLGREMRTIIRKLA